MRLRIDEGVYIDFYNLHGDAGNEPEDFDARRSEWTQLADYINANSAGNPVLVFGDTNARYYPIQDSIPLISQQTGLTDVWVQLVKGGVPPPPGSAPDECTSAFPPDNTCESIDKILYCAF
jgi:hypothetical protein